MDKFLSDLAKVLVPYVPGEQPKDKKYIKLNTNENPYPPSENVLRAIEDAAKDLKLYPDPDATALRRAIADYYSDISPLKEENIFIGNGSDEVLAFIFPAFFQGKKIAFADITYSFYPVYANLFQTKVQTIPVSQDFSLNVEDYVKGLEEDVEGILICNPNAPTGQGLLRNDIETILQAHPDKLVLVDEAYVDFGGESAVNLISGYENLLVAQTMSKSRSLAGLRIGFAMGSANLIEGINRVKNSFNSYTADRLSIAGGVAAMEDREYFLQVCEKIMTTRERISTDLIKNGFIVLPSKTNFIFIKHKNVPGEEIFQKLKEKGVLVRYFNKPIINEFLRVTIGTDAEMDIFLRTIKEVVEGR